MPNLLPLPDIEPFKFPLLRLAASFGQPSPVKIVAIGSLSTHGEAGIFPYPERLEDALSREFPEVQFEVVTKGKGGNEAPDQVTRLQEDVLAEKPALVIWQVGTNAAFREDVYNVDDVVAAIDKGLELLSGQAMDVVLMDMPYTPALVAGSREPRTKSLVNMIADVADRHNVNLFSRFRLMRGWVLSEKIPFERLVDSEDSEGLRMSDWATGAVTEALKGSIVGGLGEVKGLQIQPAAPAPQH